MKLFKKLLYLLGFIVLLLITYAIYDGHFSRRAKIGKRNEANAAKVKEGMNEKEIVDIMGKPDTVLSSGINKIYLYPSNNTDYLDIEIYADTIGVVIRKFVPSN